MPKELMPHRVAALITVSFLAAACGTGTVKAAGGAAAGQDITIAITPDTTEVDVSGQQAFAATVTGTANTSVTWSVQEGAAAGTVDAAGLYDAPGSTGSFTVVATSVADPTRTAVARISVRVKPPIRVSVSPSTPSVVAGATVTFSAVVRGSGNTKVTWAVQEATGCGTVTAAGVYTAPAVAATCHVVATSRADGSRSGMATVTVTAPATTPPTVSIAVSPKTPSVVAGSTVTFSAVVTGSADTSEAWAVQEATGCGAVTATGVYTAPAAARTCHVVATSRADGSRSDTATIAVTAPVTVPPAVSIAVSPSSPAVNACQTVTFTATVTGSTNKGVLWTVQEGPTGGDVSTAGVFTAPSAPGTYHVVATSLADGTRSVTVPVVVATKVLSVTVTPGTVSLPSGGTTQFTATVTTTCGTSTANQAIGPAGAIVGAN
jgi:hypothetical protein